jgi:gamma-glutamyltranspeptidase
MPDEIRYEPFGLSPDTVNKLKAMGHQVNLNMVKGFPRSIGDAEAVMIEDLTGVRLGACDTRREARAVGY